jgi:hypothetical protein
MAIDFFDREVTRLQDKFNETFGKRVVCNIRTRNAAMISIVGIGLLARKINKSADKKAVRQEIQEFMSRKKIIDRFFERNINPLTERSEHARTAQAGVRTDARCTAT